MAKSINSYLPNYERVEKRLQADIGLNLMNKVDKIRKSRKLTWAQFVTGLFEKAAEDLEPLDAYVSEDERRQMSMFGVK